MNITIRVDDKATQAQLEAVQKKLANPGPVLRDVGEGILQRAKARFGTGIGADGIKWKPKKHPDGNPTLIGESKNLSRQFASTVNGSTLTVKSTVEYAAIHQFGGAIQRKARTLTIRHRTNAKGELLRNKDIFGGKGLIFAAKDHKRVLARQVEVDGYSIKMPARPFLPIQASGQLYPDERDVIVRQIQAWFTEGAAGPTSQA